MLMSSDLVAIPVSVLSKPPCLSHLNNVVYVKVPESTMPVMKHTASCISYESCRVWTVRRHRVESFDEFRRDKSIRVKIGRGRRVRDEFSRIGSRVVQVERSAAFVELPAAECRGLRHTEEVASEGRDE